MRITSILLVIKLLFNKTNFSLFLYYFWIFFNDWTKFQPFQVIIIYTIYYPSSIVLWGFSYHFCVVDCWPVCLHYSDQSPLILKPVLGRVIKFSVGRIQPGYTYFYPPQVCGRSWQVFRFFTCHYQYIDWIQVNNHKFFKFIAVHVSFISGVRRAWRTLNKNWYINIPEDC